MAEYISFVSVIIPTHNRCQALRRTLNCLQQQTWPSEQFEVIVVADGCDDDTLPMLSQYAAAYPLVVLSESGRGAAVARNRGASQAEGTLLLFLDDDIESFPSLIQAHVEAHKRSHSTTSSVVIGNLPMPTSTLEDFFQINLRNWWGTKFHQMSLPQHRWTYQDLLSGNFSLSADLFRQMGGFDETFKCREDYELGMRLLKAGACFSFAPEAKGLHHDMTDLKRSLRRKFNEGLADIQMGQTHPELLPQLLVFDLHNRYTWFDRWILQGIFKLPTVMDFLVNPLHFVVQLLEWLRLRSSWQALYQKMQVYWYLRGVAQKLSSQKAMDGFLQGTPFAMDTQGEELEVDLREGFPQAERLVDHVRPQGVCIRWGQQAIGRIAPQPGAEPLRGIHLREALATSLAYATLMAIAQEKMLTPHEFCELLTEPKPECVQEVICAN